MNDDLMGLFYNGPVEPTLADLFSGAGAVRPTGGRLYGASRQPTMAELFSGAYPQGVSDRPSWSVKDGLQAILVDLDAKNLLPTSLPFHERLYSLKR